MDENKLSLETEVIYHIDDDKPPYLIKIPLPSSLVTLKEFKMVLNKQSRNYKYFFKSVHANFGVVKEEIADDSTILPCFNGLVVSWLVTADGSHQSDNCSEMPRSEVDSRVGASKLKRQRIEPEFVETLVDLDLADKLSKYALYYLKKDNFKRCAIPLTTRLAVTFHHGENKEFKEGDEIEILSSHDIGFKVVTHVIKCIPEIDLIILKSDDKDLCDKDLIFDAVEPKMGMRYLLMGYSVNHRNTNHRSLSTGVIASDITNRLRYIGSSGSFKGDNGGSCWNEDGKLIGMQVEVEKVRHTTDRLQRPASPATGGRCHIVPITSLRLYILNLIPQEPDEEMDSFNE